MANDEMNIIRDLDNQLLDANRHCLWFFYAEKDDWVGIQREVVLKSLSDVERVVHGEHGIPHAFCIRKILSLQKIALRI